MMTCSESFRVSGINPLVLRLLICTAFCFACRTICTYGNRPRWDSVGAGYANKGEPRSSTRILANFRQKVAKRRDKMRHSERITQGRAAFTANGTRPEVRLPRGTGARLRTGGVSPRGIAAMPESRMSSTSLHDPANAGGFAEPIHSGTLEDQQYG